MQSKVLHCFLSCFLAGPRLAVTRWPFAEGLQALEARVEQKEASRAAPGPALWPARASPESPSLSGLAPTLLGEPCLLENQILMIIYVGMGEG